VVQRFGVVEDLARERPVPSFVAEEAHGRRIDFQSLGSSVDVPARPQSGRPGRRARLTT